MADMISPAFRQNQAIRSWQNLVIGCGSPVQSTSTVATNLAAAAGRVSLMLNQDGIFSHYENFRIEINHLGQISNSRSALDAMRDEASSPPISGAVLSRTVESARKATSRVGLCIGWRIFVVI